MESISTFSNNSSESVNETFWHGGVKYFLENLGVYLPFTLILSIAVWTGVIGNSFVILSILISNKLRSNPTFLLILNLGVADFLINFVVNSFGVIAVFLGENFFNREQILCYFVGSVCLISCSASLVTMGGLALNRYILIFHNSFYERVFTIRNSILLAILTWIIGFILNIPNITGWGNIWYDPKTLACVIDRFRKSYVTTFAISCIIIPCCLIGFCYARIFKYSQEVKSKVRSDYLTSNNSHSVSAERFKLAKSLFVSFMLFVICW